MENFPATNDPSTAQAGGFPLVGHVEINQIPLPEF
jgi:hypothetical protein